MAIRLVIDPELIAADTIGFSGGAGYQPFTPVRRSRLAHALAEALRLSVTRTSMAGGRPIGLVTYTFTSNAQRDGFVAGTWPR